MSGFIVFEKLDLKNVLDNMVVIEKWFSDNPKKKICKTDLFTVRRGFVATDILKHTKPINPSEIFNEKVLDILEIIDKEMKRSQKNSDEYNGYAHSYAIVKLLFK